MSAQSFKTTIIKMGSRVCLLLPFNPNEVWGVKQRHHIRGTINGGMIRGPLESESYEEGERYFLALGAAWRRDSGLDVGAEVEVVLFPEGPQTETMAADIADALNAEPQAKEFFEQLPTFYRKNFMRWIESAKRPPTRTARIAEMLELLKAGKREK